MRITVVFFLGKIALLSLLLLGGYALFVVRPRAERLKNLTAAKEVLTQHLSAVTTNRLAYMELTRLNQDSAGFSFEKSAAVGALQQSAKTGRELVENKNAMPDVNPKLTGRFPALLAETAQVYKRQDALLATVFATKSYAEGVALLKSDTAVTLLTDQTNLILEYQFWLDQLNRDMKNLSK